MYTHSFRPNINCEDVLQQDLRVTKIYHCEKQAKSRNEWKWTAEKTKTHKELQRRLKK